MPHRPPPSPAVTTGIVIGAMLLGLLVGGAAGPSEPATSVIVGVLALQTLLTVGALPGGWYLDRSVQRDGLILFGMHHLTCSVPLLLLAAAVGCSTDMGIGLVALAIVPVAAGAPMYAAAAGVDPRRVAAATVIAYALGVVLTPVLAVLTLGQAAGFRQVTVILVFGLIGPTGLALVLRHAIVRIHMLVRFGAIGVGLMVIALCFGGTIGHSVRGTTESDALLLTALAIGVLRGPACATLAVVLTRSSHLTYVDAAAIVGGYKNITLSAGIALALAGPLAAAPSIGGFLGEAATLGIIARLRAIHSPAFYPPQVTPRRVGAGEGAKDCAS